MVCTQARQALPGIEWQLGELRRETFPRTKSRLPLMPSPQPGTQGLRPLGTSCDLNCVGHAYTCRAVAQESFTVVSLPCRRFTQTRSDKTYQRPPSAVPTPQPVERSRYMAALRLERSVIR